MKELIIHVGHGKTATSYVQSALAISTDLLLESGIDYPLQPEHLEKAKRGTLTRGNMIASDPLDALKTNSDKLLISSETFFKQLSDNSLVETIQSHYPNTKVTILLLVRNPIANAASSYLQAVQKGFETRVFGKYLKSFNRPVQVYQLITNCRAAGFELKIENYSIVGTDILSQFSKWLEVPQLVQPDHSIVNRSITTSEAKLLTSMRRVCDRKTVNRLGTLLGARVPLVQLDKPKASRAKMTEFGRRMADQTERVNTLLGRELYEVDDTSLYVSNDENDDFTFSTQQIEVIASFMAELSEPLGTVVNSQIEVPAPILPIERSSIFSIIKSSFSAKRNSRGSR